MIERNIGVNGLDDIAIARWNALKGQLNIWYGCKDCN